MAVVALWCGVGHAAQDGDFIRTWLLCGPFPNPPNKPAVEGEEHIYDHTPPCIGLDTDYLTEHGGEAKIVPVAGMTHTKKDGTKVAWFEHTSDVDKVVFRKAITKTWNVVGYAYTCIEAEQAGSYLLTLGSDDGVCVWLNGERVHYNLVYRSINADHDLVPINLKKGKNHLLIKVEQGWGGWGFILRIVPASKLKTLAPAALQPRLREEAGRLSIRTDLCKGWDFPGAPPVVVDALNAAGKSVARKKVKRGERVILDTDAWLDGPYALAVFQEGSEEGGTRLLWHKGDEQAYMRRLLKRHGKLRTRFGVDDPWNPMEQASPLVRRHRGLVALAFQSLEKELVTNNVHRSIGLLDTARLLDTAEKGKDYLGKQRGAFWSAYFSTVDGSGQPFVLSLPENYDPARPYPLVIDLHGRRGRPGPHDAAPQPDEPFIEVLPWGRGDADWQALGEDDMFRVVDHVKQWYRIDADRIYLTGTSMGGWGAWGVACRNPGLFAALAPRIGDANDSLSFDNLWNVPVFAEEGEFDFNVERVRRTVSKLQQIGCAVTVKENAGYGHSYPHRYHPVYGWMLQFRRPTRPAAVRLVCETPEQGKAFWLSIERMSDPHLRAGIHARVAGKGPMQTLTLSVSNVDVLTLDTGAMPLDTREGLRVQLNDVLLELDGPLPEHLFLRREADTWKEAPSWAPVATTVRPYRAGAAANMYEGEPLLIVYGTPDAEERAAMLRRVAEKLSRFGGAGIDWNDYEMALGGIHIKADSDVTGADMNTCNLILVGSQKENSVVARMLPRFPFTITGSNALVAGDRDPVSLDGAGVRFHYYNPLVPARLIFWLSADADDEPAESWLRNNWHLTGSRGNTRVDEPDLVVQTVHGPPRRLMQFTHGWAWRELPGVGISARKEVATGRGMNDIYLRCLRRTTAADYAFSGGVGEDRGPPFDPEWYRLADDATKRLGTPTAVVRLSGQEILHAQTNRIEQGRLRVFPAIDAESIDPDKFYRAAMSCWMMRSFSGDRTPPHRVVAGPDLRAIDMWTEIYGELPVELRRP